MTGVVLAPSESVDRAAYRRAALLATAAAVLLIARHVLSAVSWSDIVAVVVFTTVALVVGFGLVVPKALSTPPGTAAWAAVALAVLSVPVLLVFFFSGAPFVLGYATWFLSRTEVVRAAGGPRPRVTAAVGLVVMVLSLVANVFLMVTSWHPGAPR
jgi:hypothetical protein